MDLVNHVFWGIPPIRRRRQREERFRQLERENRDLKREMERMKEEERRRSMLEEQKQKEQKREREMEEDKLKKKILALEERILVVCTELESYIRKMQKKKCEERVGESSGEEKEEELKEKQQPDQMPRFEEKMGDIKSELDENQQEEKVGEMETLTEKRQKHMEHEKHKKEFQRQTSKNHEQIIKNKLDQMRKKSLQILTFVSSPAPSGEVIRCRLVRDVETNPNFTYFDLFQKTENDWKKFSLFAQTKNNLLAADYLISVDALDIVPREDIFVGKLRSNKMGNQFTLSRNVKPTKSKKKSKTNEDLVESKEQEELTTICYKTDFWGRKGLRKMSVTIPGMKDLENIPPQFTKDVIELQVKEADCNKNTLKLDFGGKVTRQSRRNFQLVQADNPDYIVLQFGRVFENEFMLDYRYPLSPLQAFSICLSSIHSKLSCR